MKAVIFYTVPQIHQINVGDMNTKYDTCWVGKKYVKC
jgi:hypothetical protein